MHGHTIFLIKPADERLTIRLKITTGVKYKIKKKCETCHQNLFQVGLCLELL